MKRFYLLTLLFSVLTTPYLKGQYDIKLDLKQELLGKYILGYHYGDKQYVRDSLKIEKHTTIQFKGDENLPKGIYFIVLPNRQHFEIIINKEQKIEIKADTTDLVNGLKFKNSAENTIYYEYLDFINRKNKKIEELRTEQRTSSDSIRIKNYDRQIARIQEEIKVYRNKFVEKYPDTFISELLRAMKDVEVPQELLEANKGKEPMFSYNYLLNHYFDNINFDDSGIVRSPVYNARLNYYFRRMIYQQPDSIIKYADKLIDKARVNNELFKFTVWFITYTFETHEIMGMDKVFVHMVDKYYATKQADWVDDATLFKITDKANNIRSNLIGNIAPNLVLKDINGKKLSIYDVKAKYTVLFFWDSTCGHCQKMAPLINDYAKKYKEKNIKVIGISTQQELDSWKKYVKEKELTSIIHAEDSENKTNFRRLYNVFMTPVVYLLDQKKEILAKRIDVEQLEKITEELLKK